MIWIVKYVAYDWKKNTEVHKTKLKRAKFKLYKEHINLMNTIILVYSIIFE